MHTIFIYSKIFNRYEIGCLFHVCNHLCGLVVAILKFSRINVVFGMENCLHLLVHEVKYTNRRGWGYGA